MSLMVYFKHQLQPEDVGVVPRELTPMLQKFFHDQLAAAGVEVMLEEDAVMKQMRISKQRREQLAKQSAGVQGEAKPIRQAGAGEQKQASPAPVQRTQAAPSRVRRSRKTL